MAVLILGMNDPRGTEALDPRPTGSAGWYLWRLVHARTLIDIDRWRRYSARSATCIGDVWDYHQAFRYCTSFSAELSPEYDVLAYSASVGHLFGVRDVLTWEDAPWGGRMAKMPCRVQNAGWYNDPVCEAAAEIFMEELWWQRIMQIGSPTR